VIARRTPEAAVTTTTISPQHPLVKGLSYVFIGLLVGALGVWSPAEALVICTVGFAVDGLLSSLLSGSPTFSPERSRLVRFFLPLGALFLSRGLAAYLGLS
jgi:hypothetical protein